MLIAIHTRRIRLSVAAVTFAVALVGGIASAFAQAAGGGGGGNGSGDPSAVIVFGRPGNCSPGMPGCGPVDPPVVKPHNRVPEYDPCGDYDKRSVKYRECRRQF
ncbi:MAG: hypothetical protein OEL76_18030 [Siculibacillus sp.]|nr:hypothetical protein [Siculibacillus sp.]